MRSSNILSALLVLLALTLTTACGGTNAPPGEPPPEGGPDLRGLNPQKGPGIGGTAVTLTGIDFLPGATVAFGGSAAGNVVVVSDTTITCVTPAGAPGPIDVTVAQANGQDTLLGGFVYYDSPTVVQAMPRPGSTAGGLKITIMGTGFVANSAGVNSVTIGLNPATNVVTLDDATISCVTPAGPAGLADVTVSNNNGSDTLIGGFAYAVPLLMSGEGGGTPATLVTVNPATTTITPIGPVGFSITGLALSPLGTLHAVEATASPVGPRQLLTVNATSGTGTPVGPLVDAAAVAYRVPDVTYSGFTLVGAGNAQAIHINPNSGAVTPVGPTLGPPGGGLATDPATGIVYFATLNAGPLWILNPATGATTGGPFLTGGLVGGRITAMAWLGGVLYAIDAAPTPNSAANLVSINLASGAMTTIMALPIGSSALIATVH